MGNNLFSLGLGLGLFLTFFFEYLKINFLFEVLIGSCILLYCFIKK